MLLMIFILLCVPIGIFSTWVGWRAYKVGRRGAMWAMVFLASLSFITALFFGGFAFLLLHH